MKKCPKCGAELQENARFCLFCMTSFEEKQEIKYEIEKNKRWLFLAAVLVLVLIFFIIFLFSINSKPNSDNNSDILGSGTSTDSALTNESSGTKSDVAHNSSLLDYNSSRQEDKENNPSSRENLGLVQSQNTVNSFSSKVSSGGSSSNNPQTSKTQTSSEKEDKSSSNKTSTTTSSTVTSASTTATNAEYIYRNAKYGDDFSVSTNFENCVVITAVKSASSNGEYIIPETLGGKRVLAIMGNAFCDAKVALTVKKVVVPANVKTIWNNAFGNCYNLSDIYFKGNSVYTEINAFPETSKRNSKLTIHCSANCSDRNFRYYKNSASYYDAAYKEWNG